MTLEAQYKQFLKDNPDTTFSFKEWKQWHGNQLEQAIIKLKQKQALAEMMQDDEELGLYDEPIQQETVEEYFLSCIKNVLQYKNDAQAMRFMEKYYEAKKEKVEEKNPYIGPFLLKNGFSLQESNMYSNLECTINVLADCYEVLFENEYGEVSTYTESHSIPHLVGVLTWNDLIDKNYKK